MYGSGGCFCFRLAMSMVDEWHLAFCIGNSKTHVWDEKSDDYNYA